MQEIDNWPRTIQANISRFYERVIVPVLQNALVHEEIVTGIAPDIDTFLDRAKAQVDNYTANEANKVYTLVLISLFERYLRLWAGMVLADAEFDIRHCGMMDLLSNAAAKFNINLEEHSLRATLQEALLVGNVVRHGEGRSMDEIKLTASYLINRSKRQFIDLIAQETPDSEWLRIVPTDIERYASAMIRFWGLADKQPFAVTSIILNG